jgi:putative ABC transport system permease protein
MMPVWLTRLRLRVRALLSRHHDRELRDELQLHLDLLTDEYRSQGLSPADARTRAYRDFGNATRLQETSHELFTWPALDTLVRDFRFALRSIVREPVFATVVIATLALGIGASSATFSVIDAVLMRPLPFRNPEQLGMIWETSPRVGYPRVDVAPANYVDWAQRSQVFSGLAAYWGDAFNLTGQGTPERLDGMHATLNLFALLGVEPFLGDRSCRLKAPAATADSCS